MAGQSARLSFDEASRRAPRRQGDDRARRPAARTDDAEPGHGGCSPEDGSTHVVYAAEDGGIYRQGRGGNGQPPSSP